MTERERRVLTRDTLLNYFLDACTPRHEWLVGMEFERMGMVAATGRRIPYENGPASVRSLLEFYRDARGGDPVYEGEHLIGLDGPWGAISLEPGGQVEWSSRPCTDLEILADALESHVDFLREAGEALGIRWLEVAMDPVTPLTEVPWMPKARYKILSRYLGERGRLAHRMMTQTASIQCAFDFESPEDWTRKFRAAALLAPVAVALFANSSEADGKETGYRSFRQAIWSETDPDRCGLPPVVFEPDFGIEAWLDWVLDTPTIFLHRVRGLVPAGGVPFRSLLERTGCEAVTVDDWELHLSAIFTDVRSYAYIEVRSADIPPVPTIMAVPGMWTAILYDDGILGAAADICSGHADFESWTAAMESASRLGLDGRAGGRPLRELAERILALVVDGLGKGGTWIGDSERALRPMGLLIERLGLDP